MNIARDSLDTITKYVVAACRGNALQALGIQGTDVVNLWPTEVAVLEIRKDLLDLVFEQSDGTLLHLEFQSTKERTLHRFALYDIHLHQLAGRTIRTVVLYANGVHSAPDRLDIGSASYHVENVYLAERDGNAVLDRVEAHLNESGWDVEDRIELSFVMHMRHKGQSRRNAIDRCMTIIERIADRDEQSQTAAWFLSTSARYLNPDEKERLKERLKNMVDLVKEIAEEEFAKGEAKGETNKAIAVARAMLADGADITRIARYTGLSVEELERLRKEISH
ncbi:MAG: RpnC/YadD family protein [Bacilli bacterium]